MSEFRVYLRKLHISDANDYYNYASDPYVASKAGFKVVDSIETARNIVCSLVFKNQTYAIILKETEEFIGTVSLYDEGIRKIKDVYSLGISLNRNYHGQGFGSEAIKLILDIAFFNLNAKYVEICHASTNKESEKMINNLGFKLIGYFTDYKVLFDGNSIDVLYYSFSKEDYIKEREKWQKF